MMDLCTVRNISISKQEENWKVLVEYEFNLLADVIDFIMKLDKEEVIQDGMDHLDKILTKEVKKMGGVK